MMRELEAFRLRDRENTRLKPTGRTFYVRTPTTAFVRKDIAGHHPEFRSVYLNDELGVTASIYNLEVEFASWEDKDAKWFADDFQAVLPGMRAQKSGVLIGITTSALEQSSSEGTLAAYVHDMPSKTTLHTVE